jgi:hypothetical protein
MGDVALVPQGHVLERREQVDSNDPGQPADPLGDHRVALVGHGAGALLSFPERLLDLPDLGPGQVPDLQAHLLQRGGGDREGPQELRVDVALDHLAGGLRRPKPEVGAHVLLHARIDLRVGPHHAGQLPNAHRLPCPPQPFAVTVELERPQGQLVAEGGGLGMDSVGATDADRAPVLQRPVLHCGEQPLELRKDEVGRAPHLHGQRGVQQIAGRQAEVDPPPRGADLLGERLDEGRHIVLGHRFQLPDALRRWGARPRPYGREVALRDPPKLGPSLAGQHLDARPVRELGFLGPHRGHLGERVARDHRADPGGCVDGAVLTA